MGVRSLLQNNVGQFVSVFSRGESLHNARVWLEEMVGASHSVIDKFDAECLNSKQRGAEYLLRFLCAYLNNPILLDPIQRQQFVIRLVGCVDLIVGPTPGATSHLQFLDGNRFLLEMMARSTL